MICKSCTGSKCCEQYQQLEIECPECDGVGCEKNENKNHSVAESPGCKNGRFNLDQCPQDFIRDYVSTFRLVDLFENGIPPVAGGSLDQTLWFLNAHRTLKHEDAIVLEELTS